MNTNTTTTSSHLSSSPKIIACTCDHAFQDERYGSRQRVHNPCARKTGPGVNHRCTVCGKIKERA
jgi:hypothetical protein